MTVDLEGLSSVLLEGMYGVHAALSGEERRPVDEYYTEHFRVELARVFGMPPSTRLFDPVPVDLEKLRAESEPAPASDAPHDIASNASAEEEFVPGATFLGFVLALEKCGVVGNLESSLAMDLYEAPQGIEGETVPTLRCDPVSSSSVFRPMTDLTVSFRRDSTGKVVLSPPAITKMLRELAAGIESDPDFISNFMGDSARKGMDE